MSDTNLDVPDGVVTEIEELTAKTVSGVATPANGTPFAFVKSAATGAALDATAQALDRAVAEAVEAHERGESVQFTFDSAEESGAYTPYIRKKLKASGFDLETDTNGEAVKTKKKKVEAAVRDSLSGKTARKGVDNTGGPGLGKPVFDPGAITSDEADDLQAKLESGLIKGAASTTRSPDFADAEGVLLDSGSSAEAKRVAGVRLKQCLAKEGNGGDVAPELPASIDASNIGSVGGKVKPEYLAKAAADVAKSIAWLEENLGEIEDPVQKMEAANAITHYKLEQHVLAGGAAPAGLSHAAKSTYADNQEATNALARATQTQIQDGSPATLGQREGGRSGGVGVPASGDPRAQLASLGSRTRLAAIGKTEPEPAAQLQTLRDELAQVQKETGPGSAARERDLGERITYLALRISHGG